MPHPTHPHDPLPRRGTPPAVGTAEPHPFSIVSAPGIVPPCSPAGDHRHRQLLAAHESGQRLARADLDWLRRYYASQVHLNRPHQHYERREDLYYPRHVTLHHETMGGLVHYSIGDVPEALFTRTLEIWTERVTSPTHGDVGPRFCPVQPRTIHEPMPGLRLSREQVHGRSRNAPTHVATDVPGRAGPLIRPIIQRDPGDEDPDDSSPAASRDCWPTPEEIEEERTRARVWMDPEQRCRAEGHVWRDYISTSGSFTRECVRCGALLDRWDRVHRVVGFGDPTDAVSRMSAGHAAQPPDPTPESDLSVDLEAARVCEVAGHDWYEPVGSHGLTERCRRCGVTR